MKQRNPGEEKETFEDNLKRGNDGQTEQLSSSCGGFTCAVSWPNNNKEKKITRHCILFK